MKYLSKITIASHTLALLIVGSTTLSASEDVTPIHSGHKVYQSACMVCHVAEGKPTIAPPIFAVKNHVIAEYPERDDFIQQVKNWVKAPNEEEALMPGAIRKFGLMPAMPQLSDDDLQAVAEYLFDADMDLPEWYKEHYEEEHGESPEAPESE